ncbi:MAG: IS200/IS605 family transposase [Arcobacteraceae bacterium]|nr:IS200/IS605 family transposase [Arcobacteraceae bacterium]
MENLKDIRTGRHCVFLLHVHFVFVTKYRRKAFTKEVIDFIKPIFEKVCNDFEAELIECDGESDHVHLLVNYPPKVSISKLVNSLKGVSSRKVRQQKFKSVDSKLWGDSLWSPSYFAGSCGGASLEVIKEYIESQETPK